MAEYSDGLGRLVQTRTRAENLVFGNQTFGDGNLPMIQSDPSTLDVIEVLSPVKNDDYSLRVVVSGWQIYDNKGQTVQKYEPFFSFHFDYANPLDFQQGQKIDLFYDPLGNPIRTVRPNGSEERIIYGVPESAGNLGNVDSFAATPWEVYTYDYNDNAGRTHPSTTSAYQDHWNTPSSKEIDALGRKISETHRNGSNPQSDWFTTEYLYDIRGNLIEILDALDRPSLFHVYDLVPKPNVLRVTNIDDGTNLMVIDSVGNMVERRDGKGIDILSSYDALNRDIRMWCRDKIDEQITLRKVIFYGDDETNTGIFRAQAAWFESFRENVQIL